MCDYEELAPNFKAALMAKPISHGEFWVLLGMELVDICKGWAKVRLPFAKKLTQSNGIAHGAAVFAAADSAAALVVVGMIGKDETVATVEMKINYIKPFHKDEVFAEAKIVSKGENICVCEVEVVDSGGNLIAKCLATQMIVAREAGKRKILRGNAIPDVS